MIETVRASRSRLTDVKRRLQELTETISLSDPDIHWEYDVYNSEFFPFRAHASAVHGSGPEADEVLIISMQCHRPEGYQGEKLLLYADISREDGSLLAESPVQEIILTRQSSEPSDRRHQHLAVRDGATPLDDRISTATTVLEGWLKQQHPLIEAELSGSDSSDAALP